jgi:hypothetical protein
MDTTMLTRLLACFALLSGLAAVSAPAQANAVQALGAQMAAEAKQSSPSARQNCAQRQEKRTARLGTRPIEPCEGGSSLTIFLPTVQLGSDISFE